MPGADKRTLTDRQIIGAIKGLTAQQIQIAILFLLIENRIDRDLIVARLRDLQQ